MEQRSYNRVLPNQDRERERQEMDYYLWLMKTEIES